MWDTPQNKTRSLPSRVSPVTTGGISRGRKLPTDLGEVPRTHTSGHKWWACSHCPHSGLPSDPGGTTVPKLTHSRGLHEAEGVCRLVGRGPRPPPWGQGLQRPPAHQHVLPDCTWGMADTGGNEQRGGDLAGAGAHPQTSRELPVFCPAENGTRAPRTRLVTLGRKQCRSGQHRLLGTWSRYCCFAEEEAETHGLVATVGPEVRPRCRLLSSGRPKRWGSFSWLLVAVPRPPVLTAAWLGPCMPAELGRGPRVRARH